MNIKNYPFIAHRGIHIPNTNYVENSIPAFQKAIEMGFPIELDVHITKDHKLVIIHDSNLKRITGVEKIVENCTLEELKELKLFQTNNGIPTLEEVLELVQGKVLLIIEIKNERKIGILETKLIEKLQNYNGAFMIESFNPMVLLWLKKHAKNVIRGQLAAKNIKEIKNHLLRYLLGKMVFNFITKPHFISYYIEDIDQKLYLKCQRKKQLLLAWTLEDELQYEKYHSYCDAMIFDYFEEINYLNKNKEDSLK